MTLPPSLKKKNLEHYFMVAGEVIFRLADAPEDSVPNVMRLNAVITSSDGRLAVAQLGRAQQALQMNFHNRLQDPTVKVIDVVMLAVIPLGVFTAEQFHKQPENFIDNAQGSA